MKDRKKSFVSWKNWIWKIRRETWKELADLAFEGKDLCRQLCNKANNYKRMAERKRVM